MQISRISFYRPNVNTVTVPNKSFGCAGSGTTPQVHDYQTIVPNIFDVNSAVVQGKSGANKETPGFLIHPEVKLNYSIYSGEIDKPGIKVSTAPLTKLPPATYKVGKFGPTIEFNDRELGLKIQMLTGSSLHAGSKLDVEIPDRDAEAANKRKLEEYDSLKAANLRLTADAEKAQAARRALSFGAGKVFVVTNSKEPETKQATEAYMNNFQQSDAQNTDTIAENIHLDELKKDFGEASPNVLVLAGGFGTRLYNITGDNYSKPSLALPTRDSYRLMGNALDLAAKIGVLPSSSDEITYLSGQGTISGDNVENVLQRTINGREGKDLGDGGCISKGLALEKIPDDKPLVILNADTFTNADIKKAYQAYLDHKDAAIVIPYYAAQEERAKSFGLISVDQSANTGDGVYSIKKFVEKPANPKKDASGAIVEGTNKDGERLFMANPGIYILSPTALKILKNMAHEKNAQTKEPTEEYAKIGLSKDFITPVVAACQPGAKITEMTPFSADNKIMKCYTVQLENSKGKPAYWDDLGKDTTIPKTFREFAKETKKHGVGTDNNFYGMPDFLLKDAEKNTDLDTGLVYMNDSARAKFQKFCEKYSDLGKFEFKGNVMVYDHAD